MLFIGTLGANWNCPLVRLIAFATIIAFYRWKSFYSFHKINK
jgi:hypothetical protein